MDVYYNKKSKKVDYIEKKYRGYIKAGNQIKVVLPTDNNLFSKFQRGFVLEFNPDTKEILVVTIPLHEQMLIDAKVNLDNATTIIQQRNAMIDLIMLERNIEPK